jgi:hypothetical protein
MKRNEKLAQSEHNPHVPTIQETNELMIRWRDLFARQSLRGRDDCTAQEIFDQGKGPGVDPGELTYLMMERDIKMVHRNGVTWLGWNWFDEALYGYKDKVVIRYSYSDLSQIYVFTGNGQFLCAARPVEKVHPMASESENPKDMEAVKQVIRTQKRLKTATKNLCSLLDAQAGKGIDWDAKYRRSPEIAETIKAIEGRREAPKLNSPFIDGEFSDTETRRPLKDGAVEQHGDTEMEHKGPLTGPIVEHDFQLYEWYMKQVPEGLNDADREWISEYMATSEWANFYGRKAQSA